MNFRQLSIKEAKEINKIYEMMENSDELVEIEFDLSLARGLNYYTGIILKLLLLTLI